MVIWYIFPFWYFVVNQEKSGNPELRKSLSSGEKYESFRLESLEP
jgi:hypothetical protein